MKTRTISFQLFVMLWFATLLLPLGAYVLLPVAGVVAGVVLPALWITLMPGTCFNGAFVAFPMVLCQLAAGLSWLMIGIRLLNR